MSLNMSKSEQRTAAAWFKDAGSRPDDWESVPRPKDPPRPGRKLGAQITIRLEPEVAERLREMADERGVGYTSLARELLEDAVVSAAPAEILVGSTLHVMRAEGSGRWSAKVSAASCLPTPTGTWSFSGPGISPPRNGALSRCTSPHS